MSTEPTIRHNGVNITYDERWGQWKATKGDRTFTGAQVGDVKKKLDLAAKAKINRLPVIYREHGVPVAAEISSYDGHQPRIVFKDRFGKPKRQSVYESNLFDSTDENRAIFAKIKPLQEQRGEIDSKIYELEKKLSRTKVKEHGVTSRKKLQGEET